MFAVAALPEDGTGVSAPRAMIELDIIRINFWMRAERAMALVIVVFEGIEPNHEVLFGIFWWGFDVLRVSELRTTLDNGIPTFCSAWQTFQKFHSRQPSLRLFDGHV